MPIYQTTSYVFADADHAAGLFNLERAGHIYSRISNPTVAVLEERVAALEGGVAAVATASGQAALHLAIATLMGAGSHIVAARNLYGGTVNLLRLTLPRFGIETTFVDPREPDAFAAAIRPETRLVLAEVVGNPGLEVLDLPAVAAIAHDHGLPLLVDATFLTPHLCRPFDHGADLVVHSLTKWLGGHGVAIGGILVDGGRFDWQASGQFPDPDRALSRLCRPVLHRQLRPAGLRRPRPHRGPARLRRLPQPAERLLPSAGHRDPAAAHGAAHRQHGGGARLPGGAPGGRLGRPSEPGRATPTTSWPSACCPSGAGSIVSFGVKGGRAAGARFIEGCALASHLANVGDAKTLVIHPASTTHVQLGPEQLAAVGLRDDMIRLSVGLEDPADITADLDRALARRAEGLSACGPTSRPMAGRSGPERPPSCSSTAPAWTIPSGRCRAATSPSTAGTRWRSTCRATAARATCRRSPRSRPWPTAWPS